jgi:hypothetical protein
MTAAMAVALFEEPPSAAHATAETHSATGLPA